MTSVVQFEILALMISVETRDRHQSYIHIMAMETINSYIHA